MDTRTDCHRPGLFIPGNYTYLLSYVIGRPAWCPWMPRLELDRAREIARPEVTFKHPTWGFQLGKCSVCGALFNYGDLWRHEPTGDIITMGHDCADKYAFMADRSAFLLEVGRVKEARAVEIKKEREAAKRAKFLAENEGLEAAFACPHNIVQDIKARFEQWGSISERQVALVMKLASEASKPKPQYADDRHTPAPEGRVTFQGLVVASKVVDSMYGSQVKITVKVETRDGVWLAWGTCPAAVLDATCNEGGVRGKTVEITATLKQGRDAHFALMSRPAGRVLREAC